MKTIVTYSLIAGLILGLSNVSEAAHVHAWITINPFPLVVARPAPVAVRPALVEDPYAPPPPDYGRLLADFHARAQRLQRMLDKQYSRRIISERQYNRHAEDLDAIIRDEQRAAASHGGALTPREVDSLNRRLTELQDRVHEDLAR